MNVQAALRELDLLPLQVADLRRPQTVAIGDQDHRRVAMAAPTELAGAVHQPLNLTLGEVAPFDCQVYDAWGAFLGFRFHADKLGLLDCRLASLYAFLAQSKHFRARTRLKLRQASRRDEAENARLGQEAGPGQEIDMRRTKAASSEDAVPFATGQVAPGANEHSAVGAKSLGDRPGLARCSVSERRGLIDCAESSVRAGHPPPPFLEIKKQFKTPPDKSLHFFEPAL